MAALGVQLVLSEQNPNPITQKQWQVTKNVSYLSFPPLSPLEADIAGGLEPVQAGWPLYI